jgi:hypothetical protein
MSKEKFHRYISALEVDSIKIMIKIAILWKMSRNLTWEPEETGQLTLQVLVLTNFQAS